MILLLAFLFAGAQQQVYDLFAGAASALSAGNDIAFCDAVEGNDEIKTAVRALLARADVLSSIEFLSNEGDETKRTVELDWFLQIRDRQDTGLSVRRRERVKCVVEKRGRKWKIVSFEPRSLFAPPR